MIIEEELHESTTASVTTPRRPNRRQAWVLGAATLVAAGTAIVAAVGLNRDETESRDAPPVTMDPTHQDAVVRNLVDRGVVPAASLSDGTQITANDRQARTRDDVVRDLVDRGLVPAASLSDGTQVTSPAMRG